MTNCENLTRQIVGHVQTGELTEAIKFVHADFSATEAESLPFAGSFRGPDGFVELLSKLTGAWENMAFELNDLTADKEYAALHVHMTGLANGHPFRVPLSEIWRFEDGKLIAATPYYFDTQYLADRASGTGAELSESTFLKAPLNSDSDRERNVEVVKPLLNYVVTGDWDKAAPLLDKSFAVIEAPNLPYGGEFSGPTVYSDILTLLYETWGKDFEFSIDHIIADSRYVIMLETLKGRIGGTYLEMPISEVWEIVESKVGRVVPYYYDVKKMRDLYSNQI